MDSIESRARAVLVDAEREIQGLLEEAVRSRQYEALSNVGAWASQVRSLALDDVAGGDLDRLGDGTSIRRNVDMF